MWSSTSFRALSLDLEAEREGYSEVPFLGGQNQRLLTSSSWTYWHQYSHSEAIRRLLKASILIYHRLS